MDRLLEKVSPEGRKSRALRLNPIWVIVAFILPMHQNSFDENSLVIIPHPSYRPDLMPSGFWLVRQIKTSLTGRGFNDVDELLKAVIEL
jgi:hypothetical protein